MQNLLDELTELLQAEQAFISDGAILKNAVVEATLKMEPRLLELLILSDTLRVTTRPLLRFPVSNGITKSS